MILYVVETYLQKTVNYKLSQNDRNKYVMKFFLPDTLNVDED